jgi:tetratricopeptide (TPR) repeat protein
MIYNRYAGAKRLPLTIALLVQVCFFASAAAAELSGETADSIRENRYIAESLLLQKLARQSFAWGDYDMAEKYAKDAVQAAAASDAYVGMRVNMYTAGFMMTDALKRLALADSAEVKRRYPVEFYDAKTYYNLGLIAESAGEWKNAINNAGRVINTLAAIKLPVEVPVAPETPVTVAVVEVPAEIAAEAPAAAGMPVENAPKDSPEETPLPARYVVRAWEVSKDCFWNIAGRPWVYGNPYRWPLLYQANKKKLDDPNNPHVIEPGTVIDIPSLNGEKRSGLWDSGKTYSPLGKH